jgi:hypothetical protein
MPFLTAIVALLIGEVLLIIVALSCRCSSHLLLLFLGKCCTQGCYQSSTLDDQWFEVIHQCQSSMTTAGVRFCFTLYMIVCHSLLKLTVLLVIGVDEE